MTQRELTNLLDKCSQLYYTGGMSPLTDVEFDLKFLELQKMEKESGVVYSNSPTLRVGSDALEQFGKITHPFPMLTIENVYDDEGFNKWIEKICKFYKGKFSISVKYDGISCELHYHNGILVEASTRGDKNIGDDITANVRTIKSVPLYLPIIEDVEDFYVRGEVLMPKSRLMSLNEERIAIGETPFANTRNACSGSIKQLDSRITAKRGLIFRAWDSFGGEEKTMHHKLDRLAAIGFKFEKGTLPITVDGENLVESVETFKKQLDAMDLDYDYDGVVIKIDDCDVQNEIGTKDTRAIEWGIARKWNEEYIVETDLVGVDWQVGRTGVLTPVGKLNPVECGGVVVSNVTLNNIDFIEALDLKLWKTLRITRSGGVIPYVLGCTYDIVMDANHIYPEIQIPTVCPVCGEPLVMEGKLLKCKNEKCPAKIEGRILYWCSKDCMDIKTIGESVVHDLVSKKLVMCPISLYTLIETHDVYDVAYTLGEGYGVKSVQKMFDAINKSRKEKTLDNIITSLGIPEVGKVMGRTLAKKFKSLESLCKATYEDLIVIEGIGEIMAKGIVDFFSQPMNQTDVEVLYMLGFNTTLEEDENNNSQNLRINGLNVCFSGSSSRFSGDEVEAFLERNGAKCGHSISKKTNYLITGDKPGPSKVKKAEELGVEIISENNFYTKFNL